MSGTAFVCFVLAAVGQDVVVVLSPGDAGVQTKKVGTIVDYTGSELKLRSSLGTEERILASRVASIQTRWTAAHESALAARKAGRLDDAIALLRQAKREEKRAFAVRQIMAELCGCYLEAGRVENAGDEFLGIVASDPGTIHFNIIPLAWRGTALSPAAEVRANSWLAARQTPASVLLGASWLMASRRGEAAGLLEGVAKASDPKLANLATIQLWRTKLATATTEDAVRWQGQLEKMQASVQAAGWFVVGEVFGRQNQAEQAALAYLKVPLLFREQRPMAAEALLAAGMQLEKMSQGDVARRLYEELVRDFAILPEAKLAAQRLEKMKP